MITREPQLLSTELPSLLPMAGRSKGRHVSEIISEICIEYGHYDPPVDRGGGAVPKSFLESLDDRTRAIIELGCTFEHALVERRHLDSPGEFFTPGELSLDGIYGTPDLAGLRLVTGERVKHMLEVKLTYMKLREATDDKLWRYWVQLGAYCKMAGVDVGVLCVLFMDGDYRASKWPTYREWGMAFTRGELDQNWAMIASRK